MHPEALPPTSTHSPLLSHSALWNQPRTGKDPCKCGRQARSRSRGSRVLRNGWASERFSRRALTWGVRAGIGKGVKFLVERNSCDWHVAMMVRRPPLTMMWRMSHVEKLEVWFFLSLSESSKPLLFRLEIFLFRPTQVQFRHGKPLTFL